MLLFCSPTNSPGQGNTSEASEVYLTFQYQGVVGVYITAYYHNDAFYLPVSELFNALEIQKEVKPGALTISGTYLGKTSYYFDFQSGNPKVGAGGKEIKLRADDYLIKEVDYFVRPYLFEELFGLNFSIDYNTLMLQLETEDKMPVIAQYEREQKRKKLARGTLSISQNYYPLKYNRDYTALDGAFLDYNVSSVYSNTTRLITFGNVIGAEMLGGDVQGNLFGALSQQQQSFRTNNLRWRYIQRNNDFVSSIIAGQTNSGGIENRSITGIKISNKPVEPRRLFDRYIINGQTVSESEIELYLNNQLVDYQKADAGGNYRFVVPLTYGNTNYSIRIFTPSGRAIEENTRIQIPFEYLPPGQVDYTATLGKLENNILGTEKKGYQGSATISTGISQWLTARASTEYLTDFHGRVPSFTGTLNGRLFTKYLVNISANSENFYRLMSSVVYGSGASLNASYDYNPGNSQLYNIGGNEHQAQFNLFKPFQIGQIPLNIRFSTNFLKNGSSEFLRYRTDINTRFGRLNLRLGYQDQQLTPLEFQATTSSRISNSFTYTISRRSRLPDFFDNMFIRGRFSYLPGIKEAEEVEFQLSKDLGGTNRAQFNINHNFRSNSNSFGLSFTLDFNKVRSNTAVRIRDSQFSANQSLRGSIGYDAYGNQFILNNRQQAGQAGAAVRLYIDNNNDGSYQKSIDDVISDPAVRVGRAGGRTKVKGGINYIDQLLPYYQYNIEINRSALSNPLLVPKIDNFSFITDPNQFKPIEIPFYLSGVIDGVVEKVENDSTKTGVAGLKLYLKQKDGDFSKEIRTFSDGSFYAYEIPPGEYTLSADSTQLQILGSISTSYSKDFEVRSLAQGDFITGLNFELNQKTGDTSQLAENTAHKRSPLFDLLNRSDTSFEILLDRYQTKQEAQKAARQAQLLFKEPYKIKFNKQNNTYSLRSYPKYEQQEAIDKLLRIQKSPFREAVLVAYLQEGEQKSLPRTPSLNTGQFSIQLGAFSNEKNALDATDLIQDKLNISAFVSLDENSGVYNVYTEPIEEKDDAENKLRDIKNSRLFSDAVLVENTRQMNQPIEAEQIDLSYGYNIFVKGVTPQNEQDYLSAVTGETDVDINQSPKKDLLIFENIISWEKALNLKQKLSQISTIGHPIIVLIEKK